MVYRWYIYIYNSIGNGVYKPIYILVGGAITILKNDGVRQWGWDYPIYYGKDFIGLTLW